LFEAVKHEYYAQTAGFLSRLPDSAEGRPDVVCTFATGASVAGVAALGSVRSIEVVGADCQRLSAAFIQWLCRQTRSFAIAGGKSSYYHIIII